MHRFRARASAGAALLCLLAGSSPTWAADLIQTINTNSLAYGTFGSNSDGFGPWPSSNFGVKGSYSLATDISAGVQGATQFSFPTITAGQVFHATTSQLTYGYTPSWTNASVGSHTGLSASASFDYDIGPFSGSKSIYDTAINASSSGNLGVGSTLTGGAASNTAVGDKIPFSYGLDAYVGSASVGGSVGLNVTNAITYTPTVEYGYYSWANTTGLLTGADTLTFTSVPNGDLNYLFPTNLDLVAGSNTFFLNFLPAVRMDLSIDGSATITVPLDGTFNVEAFGSTLLNVDLPLGNLFADPRTYDTWNDDVEWNNGQYYSLKLEQDNSDCQRNPTPSCEVYTVLGQPQFLSQTLISGDNTQNFVGGSTGGFDPSLGHAPKVPQACDPVTGQCWQSDDPNLPLGPGTVTFQTGGVPEPSTWSLMLLGFAGIAVALRSQLRLQRATRVGGHLRLAEVNLTTRASPPNKM